MKMKKKEKKKRSFCLKKNLKTSTTTKTASYLPNGWYASRM